MSLFDNDEYQWRETCFVFLKQVDRPEAKLVEQTLRQINDRFEIREIRSTENELFDSCTLIAPDAYAAIDLSYIEGDEVTEQLDALPGEIREMTDDPDELEKADLLPQMNARIDLMHFEQLTFTLSEDDDATEGMFDPSALILVLEELAKICHGVPVDPQSGAIM